MCDEEFPKLAEDDDLATLQPDELDDLLDFMGGKQGTYDPADEDIE